MYSQSSQIAKGAFIVIVLLGILLICLKSQNRLESTAVYSNSPNCLSLNTDNYIRDCVTDEIIGKKPSHLNTMLLEGPKGNSPEGAEQRQKSFENVFKNGHWLTDEMKKNKDAASGPGSTLLYAQGVMAGLHTIIFKLKKHLGVSRIRLLDIPCGDMVWMNRFLRTRDDIDYTGIDIVSDLISRHRKSYSKYNWKFLVQDLAKQHLNQSFDLILCRMMLQHLYMNDVLQVLKHFSDSGSRFLLTTSFNGVTANVELPLSSVRCRLLNMELPPFALTPPICAMRDGDKQEYNGQIHFLGLWELPLKKVNFCNSTKSFRVPAFEANFCSCTEWSQI